MEFHHYYFGVEVPGFQDEVLELIWVVINRTTPLEVSHGLQLVDSGSVCVRQIEFLPKLIPEVLPIQEPALVLVLLMFLPSEYSGSHLAALPAFM